MACVLCLLSWASYQIRKLRVVHALGMPGTVSDLGMHHGTYVAYLPWCIPGSLNNGFLWSRSRGKRSRHSQRMRNPQFSVSGKRPMASLTSEDYKRTLIWQRISSDTFWMLSYADWTPTCLEDFSMLSMNDQQMETIYERCSARSRYQGQRQVITTYSICGM